MTIYVTKYCCRSIRIGPRIVVLCMCLPQDRVRPEAVLRQGERARGPTLILCLGVPQFLVTLLVYTKTFLQISEKCTFQSYLVLPRSPSTSIITIAIDYTTRWTNYIISTSNDLLSSSFGIYPSSPQQFDIDETCMNAIYGSRTCRALPHPFWDYRSPVLNMESDGDEYHGSSAIHCYSRVMNDNHSRHRFQ